MKKYRTICLDYDGTIHDSMAIYYPAFVTAYNELVEQGLQTPRHWSREEVKSFIGQNPVEMWGSFRPQLDDMAVARASARVGELMKKSIEEGRARLYEGALETLQYLVDKGYQLIYLSNSKIYYMEAQKKHFGLERYFSDFVVSEMYGYIAKKDILNIIKNKLESPILMVGDRIHDIESGYENHIDTVACTYGFGRDEEFSRSTYRIDDIREIKKLL